MNLRSLVPFAGTGLSGRNAVRTPDFGIFGTLQREIDRLFDDASRFGSVAANGIVPNMDVVEKDDAIEITVEMPGLEREDVEISLVDDILTIRGEKRLEIGEEDGEAAEGQGNGAAQDQSARQQASRGEQTQQAERAEQGQQAQEGQRQQAQQDRRDEQAPRGNGQRGQQVQRAGNGHYHVSERIYGVFYRAIQLPPGVDPTAIEATMSNGVLRIRIPKQPRQQAQRIQVRDAA
jgi:HSP20 family molecular chaperone IbpA